MRKPKLSVILRIIVSLSLLTLLLWLTREHFARIWLLLSSVNISKFILAFLVFISGIVFMAWRLKIVLAVQGYAFTVKNLFSLTLIGYFFTNFMPTSVGGDLVKGYYISKKTKTKLGSYTAIFVDRIIGMLSLVLLASLALAIMRGDVEDKFIFWGIIALLLFSIISVLLLSNEKLLKKIVSCLRLTHLLRVLKLDSLVKKTYDTMNVYAGHKEKLLQTVTLSLIAQFIGFSSIFILSKSLAVDIPFGKILLVVPVAFTLCMLPVTMNGLGLREWTFVLFFRSTIGNAAALSLSLLYLAMFLLISLIGGIIYLFRRE